MPKYITIDKTVGETPLEALERARTSHNISSDTPLAYAGRLDPMAEGLLLILVGEECKHQTNYHHLTKGYTFSVLLGLSSDTGDVLGRLYDAPHLIPSTADVQSVCTHLRGAISLPYPVFSSKTVAGKPLHTWAVEERLDEITIPTKQSRIFKLRLDASTTLLGKEIHSYATEKIERIPPVTDPRKALGNDFRRPDVRGDWSHFLEQHAEDTFSVLSLTCIASSGTYMRSLSEEIARHLGTGGLALSIERWAIGQYTPLFKNIGVWTKRYR